MDSVARSLTVFKGSITAREGVLETKKKKKQDLFQFCFGLFHKTIIQKKFVLFRCFEPISKQLKQTEMFRNKPKQPKIFIKISKYALYQTVSIGLLFVSVQLKQ